MLWRRTSMPSSSADRLRAVIFDVDGTLVDSEQHGHRIAFNEAFRACGLRDHWDRALYRELLAVTGGEARLLAWFRNPASSIHGAPEHELRRIARDVHRAKTELFIQIASTGVVPPREGVRTLLDELAAASIELCVATTGSRAWVLSLLDRVFGIERFSLVVTGDDVTSRKPDPAAYRLVLEGRDLSADETLAIEDSGPGLRAAAAAGLPCVVVANSETDLAAVQDAEVVVSGFGSPGSPLEVHVDRYGAIKGQRVSAAALRAVWSSRRGFLAGSSTRST